MDVRIKAALVSVSDKSGVVEFAKKLSGMGVRIISTGGTARTLTDASLEVVAIESVTGFPEMMDGRVKTLHPKIHGGLLGLRDKAEHTGAMKEHSIEPIDMKITTCFHSDIISGKADAITRVKSAIAAIFGAAAKKAVTGVGAPS